MLKITPRRTPTRKSPRTKSSPICLDSTPQYSRPNFELNAWTPSPPKTRSVAGDKGKQKVVYDAKSSDEVPILKRFRINKEGKSGGPKSKMDKQLSNLVPKVDAQLAEMKFFISESMKNLLLNLRKQQNCDSRNENPLSAKPVYGESTVLNNASEKTAVGYDFSAPPPWRLFMRKLT